MRRFCAVLAVVGTVGWLATPAGAVPRHIHFLTTPGTTTAIATGVSEHAPCTAFLNLHENVHLGVFLGGQFPNTVSTQIIPGTC